MLSHTENVYFLFGSISICECEARQVWRNELRESGKKQTNLICVRIPILVPVLLKLYIVYYCRRMYTQSAFIFIWTLFFCSFGHFYASFQFYSCAYILGVGSAESRNVVHLLQYEMLIAQQSFVFFLMLYKNGTYIYLFHSILSLQSHRNLAIEREESEEKENQFAENCWVRWNMHEKWKVCQMLEVFG